MCTVQYNRKLKEYHVTDGGETLAAFPSGLAGRTEAERHALKLDHPAVAKALDQFEVAYQPHLGALNLRPLRAAQLVAVGAVSPNGSPGCWYVASQRDPATTYDVTPPFCDCPDYMNGRELAPHSAPLIAGYPLCKHLLAVWLHRAPAIRPHIWTEYDPVVDLFPVTASELDAMRQIWPDAYGPADDEVHRLPAPFSRCCNTGAVGIIRGDRLRIGQLYCWHCGTGTGEY